jgi:hypothetical protein
MGRRMYVVIRSLHFATAGVMGLFRFFKTGVAVILAFQYIFG